MLAKGQTDPPGAAVPVMGSQRATHPSSPMIMLIFDRNDAPSILEPYGDTVTGHMQPPITGHLVHQ